MKFKQLIPQLLIYLRLVLGIAVLAIALLDDAPSRTLLVIMICVGFASDVLDGIIARRLNVSTQNLRRLDSIVDQAFWVSVIASLFILSRNFFTENAAKVIILLSIEGLTYLLCYIRFRKEVATHAIASKFWTILLFITLIQVMSAGDSNTMFELCFYLGVVTRLEVIAILLLLRNWTHDVPSVFHAIKIRKGQPIRRSKWFNG